MTTRTRHRTWRTAARHLQRQGFVPHPLTGVWRHRGKRLRARFETNLKPYHIEVVYEPY